MADLESIIEFSIEFYKFHNVDLFQRGWVILRILFSSSFMSFLKHFWLKFMQ